MIFISDLHINDGSPADDFGPAGGSADEDLLVAVRGWREEGEQVCLAGDTFNLWQSLLRDIFRAHGPVIRELFSIVKVQVLGNHDWAMCGTQGFGSRWRGRKGFYPAYTTGWVPWAVVEGIYVEHGHFHDPLIRRWPRTCAALSGGFGWVERHVWSDADVWAERAAAWLGGTGRHGPNEPYLASIAKRAAEHGCNRAVWGHTHKAGGPWLVPVGKKLVQVWNCGCWTNGRRDFVKL